MDNRVRNLTFAPDNPNPPHIELEYLPRIADQQLRLSRLIRANHQPGQDQSPLSPPHLLIILTAGELAYRRDDGVLVIPIGTLKP